MYRNNTLWVAAVVILIVILGAMFWPNRAHAFELGSGFELNSTIGVEHTTNFDGVDQTDGNYNLEFAYTGTTDLKYYAEINFDLDKNPGFGRENTYDGLLLGVEYTPRQFSGATLYVENGINEDFKYEYTTFGASYKF